MWKIYVGMWLVVLQRKKLAGKYIDIYKKRFIIGVGSSGYEGQEVHLQAGKPSKPCKSVQVQLLQIRELDYKS